MFTQILFFTCLFITRLVLISGVNGPCTLGTYNGSKKFKCTQSGYFELIQCLKDYCVCVDPATGHETEVTRSSSKNIKPNCGKCHVELANSLSRGNFSTFKQCDVTTGKYKAKQCSNNNNCYCVNEDTGETIGNNKNVFCNGNTERIADSIDSKPITTQNKNIEDESETAPVGNVICRLPKNSGYICNSNSSSPILQWYFDVNTFECLAFRYTGCGGNQNRFQSPSDCWSRCKLADFGSCAGLQKAAKNSKGENILCHQNGMEMEKCPKGYVCTMLAFFGICCNEQMQEIYLRNYRPICINKKQPKQIESGGVPMTLIGKSCQDNFCPPNTTCKMQEIFAHCCPS